MALDARTRSSLLAKFAELLGDDDARALMSEFPSIEAEELVTKQFLRAELGELRSDLRLEMAELGTGLRMEMAELGTGLRMEMAELGTGLRMEMAELRGELRAEMAGLGGGLRAEMADRFRQQTVWLGGAVAAGTAFLSALQTIT